MNWLTGLYAKLATALAAIAGFFYIGFLKDKNKAKDKEIETLQHMVDQDHRQAVIEEDLRIRDRHRAKVREKSIKETNELVESIKHEDDNTIVIANFKRLLNKNRNKD